MTDINSAEFISVIIYTCLFASSENFITFFLDLSTFSNFSTNWSSKTTILNCSSCWGWPEIHFLYCSGSLYLFDSSSIKLPNIEEKVGTQERKRGWGLMLIQELMDKVDYESDNSGTTLTMTKNKESDE